MLQAVVPSIGVCANVGACCSVTSCEFQRLMVVISLLVDSSARKLRNAADNLARIATFLPSFRCIRMAAALLRVLISLCSWRWWRAEVKQRRMSMALSSCTEIVG